IPESITANPVAFDLALQTAWSEPGTDMDKVIKNYINYRYGAYNKDVDEGWKLLLGSLYGVTDSKGAEAIFCARPSENVTNTSTWGSDSIQYDVQKPVQALIRFRKAATQFQNSATYKIDMVDLARQVMSNQGRAVYANCMKAYKAKDEKAYQKWRDQFLQMIRLQNDLLNTEPTFMLGP
ncbi:alpha-N-acetylglucosaminidase C-terminal domain-containing protein, partial [Bradyrhizobium sp. 18BD]